MPQILGNASRAGIGGEGLDIPLESRPLSPAQLAAVRERQAAAIAAAEARTPLPRRARRTRPSAPDPVAGPANWAPASMSPIASRSARRAVSAPVTPPPAVPQVVDVIEDLVPTGPVPCKAPDCTQKLAPEFVARTGLDMHPPCRARLDAAAAAAVKDTGVVAAHPVGTGRRQLVTAGNGGDRS